MNPSYRAQKILQALATTSDETDAQFPTNTKALNTERPDLVPFKFYNTLFQSKGGKKLISWLKQKDGLGQDMFLLGSGGPTRRWAVLHYCAIARREVEYLALTRDTTESDLKQRREIVVNQNGKSDSVSHGAEGGSEG